MTSFGFNDSGGGTIVPRLAAKELARRGWDVTVFHAAVPTIPGGHPYQLHEWEADGVRLIGVHNRGHGLFDLGHPGFQETFLNDAHREPGIVSSANRAA